MIICLFFIDKTAFTTIANICFIFMYFLTFRAIKIYRKSLKLLGSIWNTKTNPKKNAPQNLITLELSSRTYMCSHHLSVCNADHPIEIRNIYNLTTRTSSNHHTPNKIYKNKQKLNDNQQNVAVSKLKHGVEFVTCHPCSRCVSLLAFSQLCVCVC